MYSDSYFIEDVENKKKDIKDWKIGRTRLFHDIEYTAIRQKKF